MKRRTPPRLALAATSILLAAGIAEVVLRVAGPRVEPIRLAQLEDVVEDRHGFAAERVFEADPELFWRLAPGITLPDDARPLAGVISNDAGLREDHPIAERKPKGETRILFVGDSCTFGYLVRHDETFVAFAEAALRARFPHAQIECINAGVPGYTLVQGWRFLETRAARLRPDLVVLNFGWNEQVSWDGRGDLEQYASARRATPVGPLRSSRLAQTIWRAAFAPAERSGAQSRPRVLPHEYRLIQADAARATERLGAELLLLVGGARANLTGVAPHDYRTPLQEEQLRFGASLRFGPRGDAAIVDGVEVLQAMARERPVSAIFLDEIHTTAEANRRLGEALSRKIEPWLAARLQAEVAR